jgi:hypothetical protein
MNTIKSEIQKIGECIDQLSNYKLIDDFLVELFVSWLLS